jgi:hypothetical protein
MSWTKGLLLILTLRCQGASELSSRELDESLPRLEQWALSAHLILCVSCRRFGRQLRLIRRTIQLRDGRPAAAGPVDGFLSDEARLRIARAIDRAAQDEPDGKR